MTDNWWQSDPVAPQAAAKPMAVPAQADSGEWWKADPVSPAAGIMDQAKHYGGMVLDALTRGGAIAAGAPGDLMAMGNEALRPLYRGLGMRGDAPPMTTLTSGQLTRGAENIGLLQTPADQPRANLTPRERLAHALIEGATVGAPFGPAGAVATGVGGVGSELARQYMPSNKWAEVGAGVAGALGAGPAITAAQRVGGGLLNMARGLPQAETQTAAAFRQEGVTPRYAGMVSESSGLAGAEAKLRDAPGAMGVYENAKAQTINEVEQAIERRAAQYGTTASKEAAGQRLQGRPSMGPDTPGFGARGAVENIKNEQARLYDAVWDKIGRDTKVQAPNVAGYERELQTKLAQAPASGASTYDPVIHRAQQILEDAGIHRDAAGRITDRGMAFEALRNVRTNVRRDIADKAALGGGDSTNQATIGLKKALDRDVSAAAIAADQATPGLGAAAAQKVADNYTRTVMQADAPTLNKIIQAERGADAFNYALAGAKDGGERLRTVMRQMDPQTRDEFASSVIRNLGRSADGEAFSPAKWLSGWRNISQEAKTALFAHQPDTLAGLDRIATIADSLGKSTAFANNSRTGGTAAMLAIMGFGGGGLGGAAGAMMGGGIGAGLGSAAGAIAPVIATNWTANLLTNPTFVRWLSRPVPVGGVPAHIRALGPMAQNQPAIADDIRQLLSVLPSASGSQTRQGGQP